MAALFTENGELTDLHAGRSRLRPRGIQARYEEIFAATDAPQIAIEVDSVRLVGTNLAIEDGTVHQTPPGEDAPPFSTTYAAVLQKQGTAVGKSPAPATFGDATDPPASSPASPKT